jgi:type VI protein secretion system component VasK
MSAGDWSDMAVGVALYAIGIVLILAALWVLWCGWNFAQAMLELRRESEQAERDALESGDFDGEVDQ